MSLEPSNAKPKNLFLTMQKKCNLNTITPSCFVFGLFLPHSNFLTVDTDFTVARVMLDWIFSLILV